MKSDIRRAYTPQEWADVIPDSIMSVEHEGLRQLAIDFFSTHGYKDDLDAMGAESTVLFIKERSEIRGCILAKQFIRAFELVAVIVPDVVMKTDVGFQLLAANAISLARDHRIEEALLSISNDIAHIASSVPSRIPVLERVVEEILFPNTPDEIRKENGERPASPEQFGSKYKNNTRDTAYGTKGPCVESSLEDPISLDSSVDRNHDSFALPFAESLNDLADHINQEVVRSLGFHPYSILDHVLMGIRTLEMELEKTTEFPHLADMKGLAMALEGR